MKSRWVALGALLFVGHVAALGALVARLSPERLRVELSADRAEGTVPAPLRPRVRHTIDGVPADRAGPLEPGLRRVEWAVDYRGGFARRVGLSRLVGPFQDPRRPPCGVRVHLGQALLGAGDDEDGGGGGPATLAAAARRAIDRALRGTRVVGVGAFVKVRRLRMRWSDARGGSLELRASLQYRRARVPLRVLAVPVVEDGAIHWRTRTSVNVRADNRTVAWVLDAVGLQTVIDEQATSIGANHVATLSSALARASARLPPIDLGDLGEVRVEYCDRPITIAADAAATIAMRVVPGEQNGVAKSGTEETGAIALGHRSAPRPDPDVALGIDLDLDTLNAVAHQMYATGALDRVLDDLEPGEWFNQSTLVRRFLSVRVSDVALALPPVFEPRRTGEGAPLTLAVETHVALDDQGLRTPARLFGRVGFDPRSGPGGGLLAELQIDDLQLTCAADPAVLEPCYAVIVEAARGRSAAVFEPLNQRLTKALDSWLRANRWQVGDGAGLLAIENARLGNVAEGRTIWLRFGADALLLP